MTERALVIEMIREYPASEALEYDDIAAVKFDQAVQYSSKRPRTRIDGLSTVVVVPGRRRQTFHLNTRYVTLFQRSSQWFDLGQ